MRHLVLSRWVQVGGAVIGLVGAAGIAAVTAGYVQSDRLIQAKANEVAVKEAEVVQAEMSNADLREMIARLRDRNATVSRELEQLQARLSTAAAQNSSLRGQLYTAELRQRNLEEANSYVGTQREDAQRRLVGTEAQVAQLAKALEDMRAELRQSDAQRTGMAARLRHLEAEASKAAQLKDSLEAAEKKLQQATSEREKTAADRDKLRMRVAELEQRIVKLSSAPTAAVVQVADKGGKKLDLGSDELNKLELSKNGFGKDELAKTDPAKPVPGAKRQSQSGWSEVETVLSAAGVDIEKFFARFNVTPPSLGGPFVAVDPGRKRPPEVPLESFHRMLKSLPLTVPLDVSYNLESRFGVRVDPFNKRRSMHTGLDFSAPFRTPVYNTAPGTVVFAGAKGEYGRVVEVDHGSGIVTRYAHLHRTTVVPGQRLAGRTQIGLLGSTGRSTGPHVHYEILVNGVPQDPERFLDAGRSVLPASATK